MKKKLYYLVTLFLLSNTLSFSQQEKEALIWFDEIIQPHNLEINSGTEYFEKYRTSDSNHHFLLDNRFNNASILYKDQWYHNILSKYDLLEDNLIILINSTKQETSIKPDYNHITAFRIKNRYFTKLKHKNPKGYYEKIATNNGYTLYKKNSVKKIKRIKKSYTSFLFKKNEDFFLSKNDILSTINKKSDWIKAFPNQKKTISLYYSQHKNNSSQDKFYINLLKKLTL